MKKIYDVTEKVFITSDDRPRLKREGKTVEAMIRLYCQGQHGGKDGLCVECEELADYAQVRLDRCPFQADKPTCARCPVHCYRPEMREKIRKVMRYAGPRMLYRHPVLALWHLIDGMRKEPVRSQRKTDGS